jgi:peroxiredoxin
MRFSALQEVLAMATQSTMLALGTAAPSFRLPDTVSGKAVALEDFAASRSLLVAFICNHCPYVNHLLDGLVEFAREYGQRGLTVVAISSNDVTRYPADSPNEMAKLARAKNFPFPYLYDESQAVAKAFDAACTPDFFVFDRDGKLAYRGQFDDSRPGNGKPITGADLRAAVAQLLAGGRPAPDQKPSIGCNIKWRS